MKITVWLCRWDTFHKGLRVTDSDISHLVTADIQTTRLAIASWDQLYHSPGTNHHIREVTEQ